MTSTAGGKMAAARQTAEFLQETLHPSFGFGFTADRVLFDEQTDHQHLVIFENRFFGRVMMLDGVTQLTTADEFIYHEMMSHMPLFALDEPREVLIIGGGDGGTLREVLKHPSVDKAVLCEIDQSVIDLSLKYFPEISDGAFDNPKAEIVIADGTEYVRREVGRFDAILVDSTDPMGPGAVLFTPEFYRDCKSALKSGGVLVTQNGVPFVQGGELRTSIEHFKSIFNDASAFIACTPTYIGGPMAYGWATDNEALKQVPLDVLKARRAQMPDFSPKYYTPEVHQAAFALPVYIQKLVDL